MTRRAVVSLDALNRRPLIERVEPDPRWTPAMHDHNGLTAAPALTALSGLMALFSRTLAAVVPPDFGHLLQAIVTPLLVLCTLGGFAYSTINFVANWPETRAKLGRYGESRRGRRTARLMDRYPDEAPR